MNLSIVATPIGNLEDITPRAMRVLKEVDLIACEDTRQTRKLFDHYQIKNRLISFREAAPRPKVDKDIDYIISEIQSGKSVAYVSDAGTPGLSDPGQYLVRRALEAGVNIIPIPGPSALAAAISVAGFSCQTFCFWDFYPKRKGGKLCLLIYLNRKKSMTSLFFMKTLND